MSERTYTTIDKSTWGPGEWQDEPDKVQWKDEETGLPCLAVRNRFGAWCGYVGVPPEHPAHGEDYDSVHNLSSGMRDLDVHGGLTFAGECSHGPEEASICHVPDPGEPDNVWWFGFDCAHAWDIAPGALATIRARDPELADGMAERATYKNLSFVRGETTNLARQLAECS